MELEKINNEYVKLKNELKKVEQEIKNLEDSANYLASDKIIWSGKLEEAKRNKDDVAKNTAETEIKRIDKDLKKVKEDVVKKQEELTPLKEKIDDIIIKIKEDPEMAKHLNEVMIKKYDRKVSSLEKEQEQLGERKKDLENKKIKLESLKELITQHPVLQNYLTGIFIAKQEIDNLKKEKEMLNSKTSKTPADIARLNEIHSKLLPQVQKKLESNKGPLMAYIAKKNLLINDIDIDELTDKGFEVDKDGKIDLDATITNNIESINEEIKKVDKKIKGNEKSLKNYSLALYNREVELSIANPEEYRNRDDDVRTKTDVEPKWYQFGQRFKNWYNRTSNPLVARFRNWRESRAEEALPEPIETSETKNEKIFKNSMKYEVVKDIVNQMNTEDLKEAKKERKETDMTR